MDIRFRPHNLHLESAEGFVAGDPYLKQLRRQPLQHRSAILDVLPWERPGIYTLTGGRQVGKTTLLKQWMAELLGKGVPPERIVFLTGELIDDHHSLTRQVTETLNDMPPDVTRYLLLDEVTYIKEWDRAVKFLADAGNLTGVVLLLTGSDQVVIREARARLPGRRGRESVVDFHLHPLSFTETVRLRGALRTEEISALLDRDQVPRTGSVERLFAEFDSYLIHGGFLTAMNDMAAHGRIADATLAVYSDWIRGDVLKRGKQERFLREVLSAIVKHAGSQVTWTGLSGELSIDHPKTVAEYVQLLESMDVVIVQAALIEDKLEPAPKKPRRLMLADPFIEHAVRNWLKPVADPFERAIVPLTQNPEGASRLAESVAVAHHSRRFPTYYIKAAGEVDIAYVKGRRFYPVEVKWRSQRRPKDAKQISKYPHGLILDRSREPGEINGIPTEPLPLALLRLGAGSEPA